MWLELNESVSRYYYLQNFKMGTHALFSKRDQYCTICHMCDEIYLRNPSSTFAIVNIIKLIFLIIFQLGTQALATQFIIQLKLRSSY